MFIPGAMFIWHFGEPALAAKSTTMTVLAAILVARLTALAAAAAL